MLGAEVPQRFIQIGCPADVPTGALEIQKADDHLTEIGNERHRSARPRIAEIGQVPAGRDEAVETLIVSKHGFDGVVGQIVTREKSRLGAVLSLPRGGPIGSNAAERCAAVRILFDAYDHRASGGVHTRLSSETSRLSPASRYRCGCAPGGSRVSWPSGFAKGPRTCWSGSESRKTRRLSDCDRARPETPE